MPPPVNVISSDDESNIKRRGGRNASKAILDSSDEDLDELSRDSGRSILKSEVRRPRHPRYPVANDTIPQPFDIEASPKSTSTPAVGSSAKMPWSIAEGPEQDIVLSTPVSKQRTLHYNMVFDSEDDLPESEKSFEFSPPVSKQTSLKAHDKHLGLPIIGSIGGASENESPSRANASDPTAETPVSDTSPAEQEEGFITQLSMDEQPGSEEELNAVKSQDILTFRRKSRASPVRESLRDRALTWLTKPRPLVLDIPSDDDLSQSAGEGSKRNNTVDTDKDHAKLREILKFTEDLEEREPSCTPKQRNQGNLDLEKERKKFEKSPFATFPIFNIAGRLAPAPEKEQEAWVKKGDTECYPLWRKRSGSEILRESSAMSARSEEEEQEEERLKDSRVRRQHFAQPSQRLAPKKMRMTETAPEVLVAESALKGAADRVRQQAGPKVPGQPARMETIGSFSTTSDSQPLIIGARLANGCRTSQVEEIEDFSDDHRSQKPLAIQERRTRRCSGLQLVSRDKLAGGLKSEEDKTDERHEDDQPWYQEISQQESSWPGRECEQEDDYDQNNGDISPTLSQSALDRCPICHRTMPVEDLVAHVDEELLANEQREKEEMEKRDKAMAQALEDTYHTQDVMLISDSRPPVRDDSSPGDRRSPSPSWPKSRQDHAVSLDTPTRKVSHLSLDSPSPAPRTRNLEYHREVSRVIPGESAAVRDRKGPHGNAMDDGPIDLSDVESSLSQSAFHIQPGQVIEESGSLSASDACASTRPTSIKKADGKEGLASGTVSTPFMIEDEILDDDLDDFVMPEPASMLNRPFRTKGKGAENKTGANPPPRRKLSTKKTGKATVDLDSEGDIPTVVEVKRGKTAKRSAKSKSGVLESMLPEPARQRRQQMLKNRHQQNTHLIDEDDEIEIGRHHPVTEKLWNQEDDLLDSEKLDKRLAKGVGLGGVVGGIGAMPGSLTVSKVTKKSAAKSGAGSAAAPVSTTNGTSIATGNGLGPPSEQAERTPQKSSARDGFRVDWSPSFDEYEDPNYGMHSQEWWNAAPPSNSQCTRERDEPLFDGHVSEASGAAEDGGYMSPLGDFVDLRKRRDDPAFAMYFAQFDDVNGSTSAEGSTKGGGRGRGRGRSRARGVGSKGVSYGPGIGPMPTSTTEPTGEQAVLTAYGIPRRGTTSTLRSSGEPATTANGSMAIRSKPTQPFVPGRGRGRGSNWRGRYAWAARARGRGRGRGRGS